MNNAYIILNISSYLHNHCLSLTFLRTMDNTYFMIKMKMKYKIFIFVLYEWNFCRKSYVKNSLYKNYKFNVTMNKNDTSKNNVEKHDLLN